MDINERKLLILKAIIDDFISTAQPVGSRTLAKNYPLGISSATIRNEMADLEDLGLLQQPHTSAGRIPSGRGYRMYVDNLMKYSALGRNQQEKIRSLLMSNMIELDDVVKQGVKILAQITGMTAVISLPKFNLSKLENIKMVKINDQKVLLILVSDNGEFKSIPLGINSSSQQVLDMITNALTHRLRGLTIKDITLRTIGTIKSDLVDYSGFIDYLMPILRDTFRDIDQVEVYVEGVHNVLNLPEFQEVGRAQAFFDTMESRDKLCKILEADQRDGISVRIGPEIGLEELGDCSLVQASYKVNNEIAGQIAVIGPMRMDYGAAVAVVDYIRETLSEIFSGINL
jgi:heat-inducible transcriptional repressor